MPHHDDRHVVARVVVAASCVAWTIARAIASGSPGDRADDVAQSILAEERPLGVDRLPDAVGRGDEDNAGAGQRLAIASKVSSSTMPSGTPPPSGSWKSSFGVVSGGS